MYKHGGTDGIKKQLLESREYSKLSVDSFMLAAALNVLAFAIEAPAKKDTLAELSRLSFLLFIFPSFITVIISSIQVINIKKFSV